MGRDYQEARLGKQLRDVHALSHALKHSTGHPAPCPAQPAARRGDKRSGAGSRQPRQAVTGAAGPAACAVKLPLTPPRPAPWSPGMVSAFLRQHHIKFPQRFSKRCLLPRVFFESVQSEGPRRGEGSALQASGQPRCLPVLSLSARRPPTLVHGGAGQGQHLRGSRALTARALFLTSCHGHSSRKKDQALRLPSWHLPAALNKNRWQDEEGLLYLLVSAGDQNTILCFFLGSGMCL